MTVHVNEAPPVLTLTIDRPSTLNAIDFEVIDLLEDGLAIAERNDAYRAVVITGAGSRSFVSGGDLRKFSRLLTRQQVGMMALRMKVVLERLEAANFWTIAAVNGAAYGGGCELALACDFRVVAERATFGFTQANFAVPPGWGGLTRLVETVGKATALRWLGEATIVDAQTALQTGLANEVVPDNQIHAAVRAFETRLLRHDRKLIGALKKGMIAAHTLPRREAIEAELDPFVECWLSPEHQSRVDAFLERTK